MKCFAVYLSEKAIRSMDDIYDYIAGELLAPDAAYDQYMRIADAISSLAAFPARIKVMDSEPERSGEVRRLLVDNYSVFFVIDGYTVTVINVLYSAADFTSRL